MCGSCSYAREARKETEAGQMVTFGEMRVWREDDRADPYFRAVYPDGEDHRFLGLLGTARCVALAMLTGAAG